MHQKALIGAASRYIAGRNAVQTVYWRTSPSSESGKFVKVSKTFNFGGASEITPTHIKQELKIRC